MRLPSKNPDCTTTILERSKNLLVLLYVTSAWKIYQSTTVGRLRSNACQEFLFSSFFFEANPSSKLKALMRQVQKQQQVKLPYFRLYQIEKTTRQKQLLAQSYNFNSRRANCRKIHETWIVAGAVPDDNLPYLNTGTDLHFVLLHIFPTKDCRCLRHLPASEYSWD